MTITIGPIVIKDYETLSWSTRRQNEIVSIPYGPQQINNLTGVELIEYQITGTIFSDTTAPKLLRRQLTELFNNNTREFTYIEFSEDGNELTGWFLLDNFLTEIIPSTFHYNFNMTVRRLSLDNTQIIALYMQDDTPLDGDYTGLSERRWAGLPKGIGAVSHISRPTDQGSIRIPINTTSHFFPYTQSSTIYDLRCKVYDTQTPRSLASFVSSPNVIETGWVERFGLGDNFEGDVVITNDLIRLVFIQASSITGSNTNARYYFHIWTGSQWEYACWDWQPRYSGYFLNQIDIYGSPTITHLSDNKIEYIQFYFLRGSGITRTLLVVKNMLNYGTYYVEKEVIARFDEIVDGSAMLAQSQTVIGTDHSIVTDNYTSGQFQTASGFSFNMGFLHTKTPDDIALGSLLSGNYLQVGYQVPVNTCYQVAVFVLPNPPPSGTTLANLGREYLSNSTQKRVLINPKWM